MIELIAVLLTAFSPILFVVTLLILAEWRDRRLLAVEGVPLAPLPLSSPRAPRPPRSKAWADYRIRRDAMYVRAPGDTEYCLPSCPSTDLFPVGGALFGSRERAEAVGLAPCTSCRPDLHPLAG